MQYLLYPIALYLTLIGINWHSLPDYFLAATESGSAISPISSPIGRHRSEAALADYNPVVRLNPNDTQPLMTRASYRAIAQNYQGAVQDYDRILQL